MHAPWSAEEKRQALELADQHGLAQSSAETGIPEGTLKSWRHRLTRAAVAAAEVVRPDAGRTWVDRRDRVVVELADTLDVARAKLHAALEVGSSKAARDLVVVVGVLAEKCELFSGGATSRTESTTMDARRKAEEILEELGARRLQKPGAA
jgi:transposase-like protein